MRIGAIGGGTDVADEIFVYRNNTTTEVIARGNLFYPGPDNQPDDLSEALLDR